MNIKLDFKTKLYLFLTGAVIEKRKQYNIPNSKNTNMFYIFEDYTEFKNYFSKYLHMELDSSLIDKAIYTKSKGGAIIALKKLCDYIITTKILNYNIIDLSQEEINDIHQRGKITQLEQVKEWEAFNLCAPGNAIGSAKWRCELFGYDCHNCLLEFASHQKEHEQIKFELTNSFYRENNIKINM